MLAHLVRGNQAFGSTCVSSRKDYDSSGWFAAQEFYLNLHELLILKMVSRNLLEVRQ